MKMIIGLGNPGVEYQLTRHNAGVMLVDKMGNIWRKHYGAVVCKKDDLWLVKTKDVFMNESGRLVAQLRSLPVFQLDNLYIAHDDLDIELGEYKIQKGRGPKEHNGVKSVEDALGTKDFWRIRIGIDKRDNGDKGVKGEDYVLQKFSLEEKIILDRVLDEIVEANIKR